MLAAAPASDHALREHSHIDVNDRASSVSGIEDTLCPGCKKSAVNENGGLVVAFGQSFFHVDCFKCAKCGDQVTADTNLLLLSDGSPICANCSYNCNVCHQPILDEAIMTGDDSYHAHCFKCKVCKSRIDELIFAKTSQGIYCMNCHNERMIKVRKHAQRKAERERAGGSSSSKSRGDTYRDGPDRHAFDEFGAKKPHSPSPYGDEFKSSTSSRSHHQAPPMKRISASYNGTTTVPSQQRSNTLPLQQASTSSPPPNVTRFGSGTPSQSSRSSVEKKASVPMIRSATQGDANNIVINQPPDVALSNSTSLQPPTAGNADSLGVSTPRRMKRGSINPGLVLSPTFLESMGAEPKKGSPTLSPRALPQQTQSPAPINGRGDSPRTPSPLRETFPSFNGESRPESAQPSSSGGTPSKSSGWPNHEGETTRNRTMSADTFVHERDAGRLRPPFRTAITSTDVNAVDPIQFSRSVDSSSSRTGISIQPGIRSQRSFDLRQDAVTDDKRLSASSVDRRSGDRSSGGSRSRPSTPAQKETRRADVPSGVDSGTDNETRTDEEDSPPALPPKDQSDGHKRMERPNSTSQSSSGRRSRDGDSSNSPLTPGDNNSDLEDLSESSPVEQVSRTTYIAPALPPIRFSLNVDEFSNLLSSVNGLPSLKSLDQLAKVTEEGTGDGGIPPTPPPSAALTELDGAKTPTGNGPWPSLPSASSTASTATISNENGSWSPSVQRNRSLEYSSLSRSTDHSGLSRSTSLAASMEADSIQSHSTTPTLVSDSTMSLSRGRAASESSQISPGTVDHLTTPKKKSDINQHRKYPSSSSVTPEDFSSSTSSIPTSNSRVTLTKPGSDTATPLRPDTSDLVLRRLREAISDANERGSLQLKLDKGFVEAIIRQMEMRIDQCKELRSNLDGMKRASTQYIEGLTVAQAEYDRELKARRDADAEVTRLRVLLSGQAARLTALSGDTKKQQLKQQMSKDMHDNLQGLEHDLSKLRVERDVTLAEMEELSASRSTEGETPAPSTMSRSLTMRLDKIRSQYQHELIPLKQQRETLAREIAELKATRDTFLEETTVLSARNEELAQLSSQYARRVDSLPEAPKRRPMEKPSTNFNERQTQYGLFNQSLNGSTPNLGGSSEDGAHTGGVAGRFLQPTSAKPDVESTPSKGKFIKWPGSRAKETQPAQQQQQQAHTPQPPTAVDGREKQSGTGHTFQQISVLRFTRCDHCAEKLWGSQLRCSVCNISIHVRCYNTVSMYCQSMASREESSSPLPPSMFGRDLVEQVHADAKGTDRMIPVIVEKCIDAVEALALDYEGIYRKTGGSGQSRTITGLFERGDYAAFDLLDTDRFNDICSVTSVLKSYFRSLPVPLLSFDLHDQFMQAVEIKDPVQKSRQMTELVKNLPTEHYYTLKKLMIHLNHVCQRNEVNLMNARNIGLVFGPTLMRSRDPAAEYGDMAGKALSIEWLVDNAPTVFS